MDVDTSLTSGERKYIAVILSGFLVVASTDLISDYREGGNHLHLFVEIALNVAAAIGLALIVRFSVRKNVEARQSRQRALEVQQEAERWKAESNKYIQGMAQAIDSQFERWQLTQAEKDVALLLLKGLSFKEIAELRNTTEKTARSHSAVVYSKSGLSGRSELAAYFLEDLLLPPAIGHLSHGQTPLNFR